MLHERLHLSEPQLLLAIAISSLTQALLMIAGLMAGLVVIVAMMRAIVAQKEVRASDSLFIDNILRALVIVCRADLSWMQLSSKNELLWELEKAARTISETYPRALTTADPSTGAWLKNRCNGIAASLRAKKMWVCIPKSDTREQLEKSLAKCFFEAVSGNWDSIETAENVKLRAKKSSKGRVQLSLGYC